MWPPPTPPTPWLDGTWRPAHPPVHRAGHELACLTVVVAGDGPLAGELCETVAAHPDVALAGTIPEIDHVIDAVVARRPDFALLCDPPDPASAMLLTMRMAWLANAPTTRFLALTRTEDRLVLSAPRRLSSLEQDLVLGLCRSLVAGELQFRGA